MGKLTALAAAALCLAMGTAGPARADGAIVGLMSADDTRVLEQFDERRAAAIAAARGKAPAETVAKLNQVLGGNALSFDDGYDPSGTWRCRVLKLGRDPVLEVYDWFSCRIFDDGAGWMLQKTTGSQRTMGRLYRLTAERLLYLGALHYGYEAPKTYGADPSRNHLAVLTRLDDGRMRLEFPAPLFESDFDILELAR